MLSPTPAERDNLVAEIHAAFGNVTRTKDAISWPECVALDNYESEKACRAARKSDPDTAWAQLIDDEFWEPFPGIGGFSFINLEGFQYYLPATMVRFTRGDNSEWFPGHLIRAVNRFTTPDQLGHWSPDQLSCIAHFFQFMSLYDAETQSHVECGDRNAWADALGGHWAQFL